MALAPPVMLRVPSAVPAPRLRRRTRRVLPYQQAPRLSIIIVNYRLWEETARLVRELLAAPCTQRGEVEVVVVDNHSPPHPLARRVRRWNGVSLRRWERNRGFAHAVNEGCRLGRGQWLLLLNPDISVLPGFVEGVLDLADRLVAEEPRAGVVGFRLRNSDGTRQHSAGPFPTLLPTLLRLALPRTRRKYHFLHASRRRPVPWVTGCCMMLRRECVEELGGLDRDFFLYYEDVDFCRRARERGWSVWYEPALQVFHHHPLHSRPVPAYLRLLTRHALLTYAWKHWPGWQLRLLAGLVSLEARLRRQRAGQQGNRDEAQLFAQLQSIAGDIGRGSMAAARQRLRRIVRREERARAS